MSTRACNLLHACILFLLLSLLLLGCAAQTDESCALDEDYIREKRDAYEACQADQGAFGNWKKSRRCVSDYYYSCMALPGTQYCTVVRSTNYAFGVCLNATCPRGECSGPYVCTGAEEEMRKLVGTMDETDVKGCCDAESKNCFRKPNAATRGRGIRISSMLAFVAMALVSI